jgi:anti-sigma B factor antagonist
MRIIPPRELDPATAPELEAELAAVEADADVVLDFAGVEFCDSSGLRVLVDAYKRLDDAGGSLRVVHVRPNVRRVFEVTGLVDRLIADPGAAPT